MKALKHIFLAGVMLLVAASCDQKAQFDHELGLSARTNHLTWQRGSTPVVVYSNTSWRCHFVSPVDWAVIDRVEGSGCGQIIFSYAANESEFERSVAIAFEAGSQNDTIMMIQQPMISE